MYVRTQFRCREKGEVFYEPSNISTRMVFYPVTGQISEDPAFFTSAPAGNFILNVVNPAAATQFEAGGIYNLDIRDEQLAGSGVRVKMSCSDCVPEPGSTEVSRAYLQAVTGDLSDMSEEDKSFFLSTPMGVLSMVISRPEIAAQFVANCVYYVDITPVE